MHLEGMSEFKVMQSKKGIGYTYFRFEKNAHKELVDRPVAAFNIDGAYLLIPFSKSQGKNRVITDEMINQRFDEVISTIRGNNGVITQNNDETSDELEKDAPWERFELPRCGAPAAFKSIKLEYPFMNASSQQRFAKAELCQYLDTRNAAIQPRSRSWNNISAKVIWEQTRGELSETSVNQFNQHVLNYFKGNDRRRPLLFFKGFLSRKPDYEVFARLLTIPKTIKHRGGDPVTIDDVKNVLTDVIQHDFRIEGHRERNLFYCLFYAYTGIRPETATHLTIEDFDEALAREKPYLYITSKHEPKVKNDYYIPLHPVLIPLLKNEIERYKANPPRNRKGGYMPLINQSIIQEYLQQQRIPLLKRPSERIQQNHFRKFFQQQSRRNGLDKDYTNFIMNHEQYGLSKESYDTFIEEHEDVYDKYIAAWGCVNLLGTANYDNSLETSESDADFDLDDVVNELEKSDEELYYTEIESDLGDINYYREGIRHLNGLMPSKQRIDVDDYLPTIDDIKNIIHIRLEKCLHSIETGEEYNQKYLEELKKEAKRYSDLGTEEERRYQGLREII